MKSINSFAFIIVTSLLLISCRDTADMKELKNVSFSVAGKIAAASWRVIQKEAENRIIDKKQKILIIGDSMADGFGFFLLKNFRDLKHTLIRAGVTSTSSMFWTNSDSLNYLVNLNDPDFIIIFLGSNEYKYKDTANLVRVIKKIERDTRGVPFIWVGPELDTKDGRYNRILESVLGRGRYVSLKEFAFEKGKIKNHPSEKGWTELIGQLNEWIITRSDYPLRLL